MTTETDAIEALRAIAVRRDGGAMPPDHALTLLALVDQQAFQLQVAHADRDHARQVAATIADDCGLSDEEFEHYATWLKGDDDDH